ncbi:sugar phosphate isomerase/epimerase [Amycolatopsis sp. WAC 04169]|uniref:sugar phosphate isomerase/epimerase family protein n=1 Tax=Amycolatopsis sp. WAC 04169 TaxID=2203197 RepID=UPI000F7BA743|nr:sugar phosphate isomerase/epimerase family protein [Amycolatopsis sp. WAC 04169]RSN19330.1 sugar phosphate isomerase/epimerase [Amycolatopsis sp. WAC 04169]
MPSDPVLAGITDEAAYGIDGQLAALCVLGWRAMELRSVDRVPIADLTDEEFAAVSATLSDNGVRVICLASRIGSWARPISTDFQDDLRELDVLAARARTLGTNRIRIMSYPNAGLDDSGWRAEVFARITTLAERAERHGVTLLHENCSGWAGTSGERMLDLLDEIASPALKLLFDTGNGVAHGYDGFDLLTKIVRHVEHVHIKDADERGFTLPGEGAARVADCVKLLRANGYRGAWSLEPHLSITPHGPGVLSADAIARFVSAGRAMAGLIR